MVFIICESALTLSSALDSCRRPMTALKTVRPASTTLVGVSWVTIWLTTAAPSRISCMKSSYWRRNARQAGSLAVPVSTLAPYDVSRDCASAALRPRAGSTPRPAATCSAVAETGSTVPGASAVGATGVLIDGLLTRWLGPAPIVLSARVVTPHPGRGGAEPPDRV